MQLVLGIRIGAKALVEPGLPAPPAPEPWWRRERIRRAARLAAWIAALALVLALGVVQGARVAIGAEGVSALARGESAAPADGSLERDAVRGALWRPAGSRAERPASALSPRRWEPEKR